MNEVANYQAPVMSENCEAILPLSRPSAHKLRAMADALGVTTDYLLGGSEDNSLKANIDDVHGGTSVAGATEGAERRTRSYWICFAGSRSYRKTRSAPLRISWKPICFANGCERILRRGA